MSLGAFVATTIKMKHSTYKFKFCGNFGEILYKMLLLILIFILMLMFMVMVMLMLMLIHMLMLILMLIS